MMSSESVMKPEIQVLLQQRANVVATDYGVRNRPFEMADRRTGRLTMS